MDDHGATVDTCAVDATGAYTADRAAALSGVPISTVHYWSRHHVLVPSISATRIKLWSYADLMGLRTIYWLRQEKLEAVDGSAIPRSTMPAVRRAMTRLRELDLALWTEERGPAVRVTRAGDVFVVTDDGTEGTWREQAMGDVLDLIAPFQTEHSTGPDLHTPRPHLRIVPGKLAGSPHIIRRASRLSPSRLWPYADSRKTEFTTCTRRLNALRSSKRSISSTSFSTTCWLRPRGAQRLGSSHSTKASRSRSLLSCASGFARRSSSEFAISTRG